MSRFLATVAALSLAFVDDVDVMLACGAYAFAFGLLVVTLILEGERARS